MYSTFYYKLVLFYSNYKQILNIIFWFKKEKKIYLYILNKFKKYLFISFFIYTVFFKYSMLFVN